MEHRDAPGQPIEPIGGANVQMADLAPQISDEPFQLRDPLISLLEVLVAHTLSIG